MHLWNAKKDFGIQGCPAAWLNLFTDKHKKNEITLVKFMVSSYLKVWLKVTVCTVEVGNVSLCYGPYYGANRIFFHLIVQPEDALGFA